jgi:ELWxxDGT repeat protein
VETLLPKHSSTNGDEVSQTLFKGSQFFFVADDGANYTQLWVSDGSFNGTKMLVVNPNGHGLDFSEESGDFSYEVTSDHIYFPGMNNAYGKELWRSDGTQGGTLMVNDTRAGSASSNPAILGAANGRILFTGTTNSGPNLYRLDQQTTSFASGGPVYVCPGVGFTLHSDINGNSYQWQVKTPDGYINLTENANFSGTQGAVLSLVNLPSTAYGWEFRCLVDGSFYSRSYTLRFLAYWVGAVSNAWENPANWQCGAVPDANTDVLIQCMYNAPIISSNASCRSLILMNRQQVRVATGFSLTITNEHGW